MYQRVALNIFFFPDHASILRQIRLLGMVPTSVTFNNDRSREQNLARKAAAENLNSSYNDVYQRQHDELRK